MSEYFEEDFLQISAIQHYVFCKRQWALIHIEQQWQENEKTIQGAIMHEKVHNAFISENRKDIFISRGMSVSSRVLGITGVCDAVEFYKDENGVYIFEKKGKYRPVPIEYKRGKPKKDLCDIMQLVAQAVCIEEMLLCQVKTGYLYYGETKRRHEVEITPELKNQLSDIVQEMHSYFERKYTPKVKTSKKCNSCSLNEKCLPKLCSSYDVEKYIKEYVGDKK